MRKFLKPILGGQQGMGLTMALIMVAITTLLSVPLMEFLSSVLRRSTPLNASIDALYCTDAATEDAIWRLAYDLGFLQALVQGTPQVYSININGASCTNNVSLHNTSSPPPPPPPPVTCGTGVNPLTWTSVNPSVVNLAQDPEGQTGLTLHILNCGTAQATIKDIREVLPAGFVYDGDLQSTNLLDQHGDPFSLEAPTLAGAPWSFTGPNPWNNCNSLTTNQASNQQRVAWSWPNSSTAPRVEPGTTAQISFDIELNETLLAGSYPDAPWLHVIQNQCQQGNDMQAGVPTSITMTYTAIITSSQGNSSVTSLVEISPDGHKIKAQLNGN